MSVTELKEVVTRLKQQGLDRAYLTMPTPKFRGAYPLRVRTPFGLCRWYPANTDAVIIIYPTVAQIERTIKKLTVLYEGE